jgi:CheY-like chemotaxis protein
VTALLIVDDPIDQYRLWQMIAPFGPRIVSAATTDEGLSLARVRTPDVVIGDLQSPGVGGIGLLKTLRRSPVTATVRAIAVGNGTSDPEGVNRAMESGIDASLSTISDDLAPYLMRLFVDGQHAQALGSIADPSSRDHVRR